MVLAADRRTNEVAGEPLRSLLIQAGIETEVCLSEHHLSHYWEMKFIQEGRQALLHGAKVGAACILMAERYERLRGMSREDAEAACFASCRTTHVE